MIVRETEQELILTGQHDHARLSGDVAKHFKSFFADDPYFDDVLFAVYHHDLSWIRLDETPLWNDAQGAPYSFTDYPLLPKLLHYREGLDQTESMNPYAALLCSMHYSPFTVFQNSAVKECIEFSRHEARRQERIRTRLNATRLDDIAKQFRLLQLCDVISLYVCLNRPGANKEHEYPRYAAGFEDSGLFNREGDGPLIAHWVNEQEIRLTPNPFEESFSAKLRQKRVCKKRVEQYGFETALEGTEWHYQEVVFCR